MDRLILRWCRCCGTGTFMNEANISVKTNPCSWETLAELCSNVWRCLSSSGPCGQCLILHLLLPETNVHIDVGNFKVKAAGVLCILGISVGIGSYIFYKIYDKFIRPNICTKPSNDDSAADEDDQAHVGNICWVPQSDVMGNQYSSPTDIPVFYKAGFGVSLNKPIDGNYQICNRKCSSEYTLCDCVDPILKQNLQKKNGFVSSKNSYHKHGIKSVNNNENGRQRRVYHASSSNRMYIDESGFVEGDTNEDKYSLKGNFSPSSLCQKNLRLLSESGGDLEAIARECQNRPKLDVLKANKYMKNSKGEISPSTREAIAKGSKGYSIQSTKLDVVEIHSMLSGQLDAQPFETDIDQEQLSPLSYDSSPPTTPNKLFAKTLELKLLGEIASQRVNRDTDPYSFRRKRLDSTTTDMDNSISGISSPELQLVYNESTEEFPVVNSKTFTKIEDEIHVVGDVSENIYKDIHTLSSKCSSVDLDLLMMSQVIPSVKVPPIERYESAESRNVSEMDGDVNLSSRIDLDLKKISKKYPLRKVFPIESYESMDSRNVSEIDEDINLSSSVGFGIRKISKRYPSRKVHPIENYESTDSRNVSEIEDLSWEPESHLYSESEYGSLNSRFMMNLVKEASNNASSNDPISQDLSLRSQSVSCAVEIDGSLYEDEFHLHLGTKAIPKHKEPPFVNISMKYVISEYAAREWKGNTEKAKLMRQAYKSLSDQCQCCHLRRIRADNYCGIRSTLYQVLVNGLPNFNLWASREKALETLSLAYNDLSSGTNQWIFTNRLSFMSQNLLEVMQLCVTTLYAKLDEIKQYSSYSEREACIEKLLNSDPKSDLELMEGVKLLMLLSAFHLNRALELGEDVPEFSILIFSQDTSGTIAGFVKNHLNTIGDSGGLEQVDLCLLGYTLGVRICVYRLQQYLKEDFILHYPKDGADMWPVVSLIAEDDRHYNIPVV